MRALFWVIAIFALGAGLVVAARYYPGYVLLVWPPYRVELSASLLLVLLLLGYALVYAAVRMVTAAVALPARVREYRAARHRQREHDLLLSAVRESLAVRFAKAEKAAAPIVLPEYAGVAAVLAARAAHELGAPERRDAHLAHARPEDAAMRIVAEAQFLIDEQKPREAMNVLRQLPRKHTAALRLELRIQQALGNWEQVLPLVDQLEKRQVLDPVPAQHVRRRAYAESLMRKGNDAGALAEAWKKVPAALRKDPRIAAAAAQAHVAAGDPLAAQHIIESALEENWNAALVTLYGECRGDTVKQIERAEAWLRREPRDAALLLALARLCARQGVWGKAQNYVDASISVEPSCEAHLEAARLQEQLGGNEAARAHYHESLDLALARLRALQEMRGRSEDSPPRRVDAVGAGAHVPALSADMPEPALKRLEAKPAQDA
jgi:HemY protein